MVRQKIRMARGQILVTDAQRTAKSGIHARGRSALSAGLFTTIMFLTLIGMSPRSLAVGPVATKATCGQDDRPETGLQGQTNSTDRFAPGPSGAFRCNLQFRGQAAGDGAGMGLVITDRCAYYSQWQAPELVPILENPGVVVVDVANSASPRIVKYLKTPAMLNSSDSLAIHQGRKLIIAQTSDQTGQFGKTTDIYDVSDCLSPVLKFSGIIPGFVLHTGVFTRDGMTVWGASGPDKADTVTALDVTDPSNPKVIATWSPEDPKISRFHGVGVNDDGNTAYITIGRHFPKERLPFPSEGLGILDVSEVQARKPNARIRMIGQPLFWDDTGGNQYARPMTIKGRKYVWENDIEGVLPVGAAATPTGRAKVGPLASRAFEAELSGEESCRRSPDRPGWGYIHIIDVEDPAKPVRVSGLRQEVHEPRNCLAIAHDPTFTYGYAPMFCDVDNYQDAKMMVCSFMEGGVRVYDIRDVKRPRELAYYKPPAVGAAPRKASPYQSFRDPSGNLSLAARFHTADGAVFAVFANDRREIWFTSYDNGFQVVRFSDEFMAREKALFAGSVTCNGKLRGEHGCD